MFGIYYELHVISLAIEWGLAHPFDPVPYRKTISWIFFIKNGILFNPW